MNRFSDTERIAMAAVWADDAAIRLADELNTGRVCGTTIEAKEVLDRLYDGLRVFAETLHALNLPYPPPEIPQPRSDRGHRLRLVK